MSSVKRKRGIKSYAGFTISAAVHLIEPLTKQAYEYAHDFLDKRTTEHTGNLKAGLDWNARGPVGVLINSAPHSHLIEFGTGPRYDSTGAYRGEVKPIAFMRSGRNKAMREAKKEWKGALQKAYAEQSR